MSWGGPEFFGEFAFDDLLQQPGVSYFAGSGDNLSLLYPSASPYVVSVGGTTLKVRDTRRRSETAWSLAGGGCAAYEPAHPAQSSFSQYGQTGCNAQRAAPDVAVVGDPATGVSVYTSFGGVTGWYTLGGTSASTPIVAGWAATTGQQVNASFIYGFGVNFFTRFFDITAGQPTCLVGFDTCSGRGSFSRGD
jgi:subtilase family serine protease